MKRAMFYLAFVAAMPLVSILMAGRIVFFGTLDLWDSARACMRPADPSRAKPRVWPFWLAWFVAAICVAVAIAGGAFIVGVLTDWSTESRWISLSFASALSLLSLFVAYRAALAGTQSLQRTLAGNLAMLIAFELDELRCAAEQRAQFLDVDRLVGGADRETAELPVPAFFAEREEIRNLLGEPTERALADLLSSLQGFNLALSNGDFPVRMSRSDLKGHLSVVYAHLGSAMSSLAPHLRQAA